MSTIEYISDQKTVDDLVRIYEDNKLNLNPGFQRRSVWNLKDRVKLIDSIINNYPLPSIFLYKRETDGEIYYDVIDGKQRIESIFQFIGVMKGNKFQATIHLPETEEPKKYSYNDIKKLKKQSRINGYRLQTIEVKGDFSDIVNLFVRINSTGKALSASEKRHANYYNNTFLKKASQIAEKNVQYFINSKILSRENINRMKHIELISELMLSIHNNDVINKKNTIDKIMKSENFGDKELKRMSDETQFLINFFKTSFPEIRQTRFHHLSDFYTLFVLFSKYRRDKFIINNKHNLRIAWDLLKIFSNGVDEVRIKQKKISNIPEGYELHRDYLLTVTQDSDSSLQRRNREIILSKLLYNLFDSKDKKRSFSEEQRRLLWNTSNNRKCVNCGIDLTWNNFTIDHINPWSKGGQSDLNNAALMCRSCNSKKGNRRRR